MKKVKKRKLFWSRLWRIVNVRLVRFNIKISLPRKAYVNDNCWIPYVQNILMPDKKYFDHANYSGLYLKWDVHDDTVLETLLIILVDASPTKWPNYITELTNQSNNSLDFLRRLRFEIQDRLNRIPTVLNEKGIPVEPTVYCFEQIGFRFSSSLKREMLAVKQRFNDILKWLDDIAIKKEQEFYEVNRFRIPIKWLKHKKDFIMYIRMPLVVGYAKLDKSLNRKNYTIEMGKLFGVDIGDQHESLINSAKENQSYEDIIKDLEDVIKAYRSKSGEGKIGLKLRGN